MTSYSENELSMWWGIGFYINLPVAFSIVNTKNTNFQKKRNFNERNLTVYWV